MGNNNLNHIDLRNVISKKVTDINNYLSEKENRKYKDEFIEKYTLCELSAKLVIKRYYDSKGKTTKIESINLYLTTIKSSLKYCRYSFDEGEIEKLFKSNQKRGSKSARDLRNGIVHSLNCNDINEVISRKKELIALMDRFLDMLTVIEK